MCRTLKPKLQGGNATQSRGGVQTQTPTFRNGVIHSPADFVARGETAREAAETAIALLSAKATGTGGLIVVDRKGNIGFAWNSQHMKYAYITEGMDGPVSGV